MFKKLVSTEARQKFMTYGIAAMMPALGACVASLPAVFSSVILSFVYEGNDVNFSINAINGPEAVTCRANDNAVTLTKGETTDRTVTFNGTFTASQLIAGRNAVNCTVTGKDNSITANVGGIYVVNATNIADIAGQVNLLATRDLTLTRPSTGTTAVDKKALVYGGFDLPQITFTLQGGTLPSGLSVNATTGNIEGDITNANATGNFDNIVIRASTNGAGNIDFDEFSITVN
ncbi:Uncharacterised protein [BD1-7 clade bacterium]|uniref:Uncharacterized protein n=1 Tax=BD1-7 clade bacterium TaxID=2029982 RepID=A0A5S9QZN9_9GAMM|nr:Uncharacterised protein [BD1-7 clade bacterium]